MAMTPTPRRGGDVVVETLSAVGTETVVGLPGQHALGVFDALRRSELRYVGFRTETGAAFGADGYARVTGRPAPALVSTGPGALFTLPALQEAWAASVPVIVISSQVPSRGLGGRRRGYLHELPDQAASFRRLVKSAAVVRAPSHIPDALAEAWEAAVSPPFGPTLVEIPEDVLRSECDLPRITKLDLRPRVPEPRSELVTEAVRLLDAAARPAIVAGGGVVRSEAQGELEDLVERLRAPVATTFGGKGAFAWDHPLSLQSWLEESSTMDFLADADVLLVVGSGLGELSSRYHTFHPRGRLIQIDADLEVLEANHPALALHADARLGLRALASRVRPREADGVAERRVAELLARVGSRLDEQDLTVERDVLSAIRAAVPDEAHVFWDMTILGYWAWSAWDPRSAPMHSAQGAGGLGYAWAASLGAAIGQHGRVFAVSGDGGAMYGVAELATARQHDLNVTWLIVDDGGYGILREYMGGAFGSAFGTELARPDFVALAESFGVRAVRTRPDTLAADLDAAGRQRGPAVVVLPARPRMFAE